MKLSPIFPFEPISTVDFPRGDKWTAQIKWDGVRILSYYDGVNLNIYNRKQNERTLQYPELTDPRKYCSADSFIFDGEVIAFDNGKPSFHEVMKRDGLKIVTRINDVKNRVPITYMIFDVLYLNGSWVTDKPLNVRQSLLNNVILPYEYVQIVQNHANITDLYKVVEKFQLEGIVIKDLTSTYSINGKDARWQKKKLFQDLIAVVGGVTYRDGTVNSLLLGLYDEEQRLWYIGHAGTGKLKVDEWRIVTQIAKTLELSSMPFVNKPARRKDAQWVKPELTVKVNFMEWTKNKTLRQPSIQAFVNISPMECRLT